MAAIRAVLIDLDQTLVDSRSSILVAFERAFASELGRELSRADLLRVFGRPLRTQMVHLAGEENADRLVAAYRRHLEALDHLVTIFPGWAETLAGLRTRGCKLAVVTSKSRGFAFRHLALHSLVAAVDLVITADDTPAHKPDPAPFLMAAAQLGLPAASCLVVGDSPWDVLAGISAGMTVALAEWGMFEAEAFEREGAWPHFRLRCPEELLALCESLARRPEPC